jgi:hypothetical protein
MRGLKVKRNIFKWVKIGFLKTWYSSLKHQKLDGRRATELRVVLRDWDMMLVSSSLLYETTT